MTLDSTALLASGLDLTARASVVLAIALTGGLAFGRRRPLVASAIGQAALVALALLPASALLMPPRPWPVLRAEPRPAASPRPPAEIVEMMPTPESLEFTKVDPPAANFHPVAVAPTSSRFDAPSAGPAPEAGRPVELASALVAAYATVALAMLARLVGSLLGVARLRRSAEAVDDPAWLDLLGRIKGRLGVVREVALARSPRVGVPVVVGWLRPMILLPGGPGRVAPVDHAEAILLHELAHVARGDYGWNLLLKGVEAAYWFHPLAWVLGRVVAGSRERACDAYCVHEMGGPSAYRAALIGMAEGLVRRPSPSPALGLAMANRSRLAGRIEAIDRGPGESRCLPRRPARLALLILALGSAALIGPAKLTRAEPSPIQEPKAVEAAKAAAQGRTLHLRLVSAETGKPIAGADVRVSLSLLKEDTWRKADEQGRLDIVHGTGPDDVSFNVDAWGDGFAMQRHAWGVNPNVKIPDEVTIKLWPGESLGGMVLDEEGRPISGAEVYLFSHNFKRKDPAELLYDLRAITGTDGRWKTGGAPQTTGNLLGFQINHPDFLSDRGYVATRVIPPIEELRAGTAVSVMTKGVPIEGKVLNDDGKPVADALVISTDQPGSLYGSVANFEVRTGPDGRFRTGQVKAGDWHLLVRAKGHSPAARKLTVGTAIPSEEVRLGPPHSFRARVVDPEGKPIEGAFVNIDTWRGYRCLGVYLYTDADGRVRWDDAPGDDLTINIDHPTHLGYFHQKAPVDTDNTFTLNPSLAISGIVRDASTLKGIEGAEVEYGAVDPKTGEVAIWRKRPAKSWVWYNQGWLTVRFAPEAEAYKIRILTPGYPPFVSRAFGKEEKVVTHYDITMTRGSAGLPTATAIRPDGRPLAGAKVYWAGWNEDLRVEDGEVSPGIKGTALTTAADGSFPIPQGSEPTLVLVVGDDCYATAGTDALARSPRLQARLYARVEGRYRIGDRPGADKPIELSGYINAEQTGSRGLHDRHRAKTDAEGRFAFGRVMAMSGLRLSRQNKIGWSWSLGQPVEAEEGKTTVVAFGGRGQAITGRVEPPIGWGKPVDFTDQATARIETDRTNTPFPLDLLRGKTSLNDPGWMNWLQGWQRSPEGRAYASGRVAAYVPLAPDGSFRLDDVPTGDYLVTVDVNQRDYGREPGPFLTIARTVAVPPLPGGRSDQALDLGPLPLRPRATTGPKAGDPAPAFEVTPLDGKKLDVPGHFRGKFLLLDLGTLSDDQTRLQLVRMNDVAARFGADPRFAMISLLMAADTPEARAFLAGKGQVWPQAVVGPIGQGFAEAYAIEPGPTPPAILIGPDGRVVARDLYYQEIGEAVAAALGAKGAAR